MGKANQTFTAKERMAAAQQLTSGWGKTTKRLLSKKEWLEHDNWQVDGERQSNVYCQRKKNPLTSLGAKCLQETAGQ